MKGFDMTKFVAVVAVVVAAVILIVLADGCNVHFPPVSTPTPTPTVMPQCIPLS